MTEPKILLIDLESTPILGYTWTTYKTNVIHIVEDWRLLSLAWKFLGEKQTQVVGLPDFELYQTDPKNDRELARLAHDLYDEADVVCGHNSVSFDTPKFAARMLVHGLTPPSPVREIDTCRLARHAFGFSSNRLDDLCRQLGIGGKLSHAGFDTWLGCMEGDPKMWALMKKYNKHDVEILEQLYLKLRPWDQRHPALTAYVDDENADCCPKCQSGPMIRKGWKTYAATRRQRFQCKACGAYSVGRKAYRTPNIYT